MILLTGCQEDPPTCLPPVPVVASAVMPDPAAAPVRPGAVTVPVHLYLDSSASMAGFAAAQAGQGQTLIFQDLLGVALPDILYGDARQGDISAFGTKIVPADRGLLTQARNPAYFKGNPVHLDGRIVDPLQRALAAPAESLSVIVTDLFLSGTDMPDTGASPLGRPLARLLRDGRAIGIIGVMAPFRGRIHDLPTVPASVDYTGLRPLFMLVVGPQQQVEAFHAELSRGLLRYVPAAQQLFLLFSDAVAVAPGLDWSGLALGAGVQPRRDMMGIGLPPTIPALRLAPDQGDTRVTLPIKVRPPDHPGLAYLSGLAVKQRVYAHQSGSVCSSAWTELTFPADLGKLSGPPSSPVVEIFGDGGELRKYPGNRTLVLQLDVVATVLDRRIDADAVLTGWSIGLTEATALVRDLSAGRHPAVFPALNLDRLVTTLTDVGPGDFQPVPLTTLQIVFRRE